MLLYIPSVTSPVKSAVHRRVHAKPRDDPNHDQTGSGGVIFSTSPIFYSPASGSYYSALLSFNKGMLVRCTRGDMVLSVPRLGRGRGSSCGSVRVHFSILVMMADDQGGEAYSRSSFFRPLFLLLYFVYYCCLLLLLSANFQFAEYGQPPAVIGN